MVANVRCASTIIYIMSATDGDGLESRCSREDSSHKQTAQRVAIREVGLGFFVVLVEYT